MLPLLGGVRLPERAATGMSSRVSLSNVLILGTFLVVVVVAAVPSFALSEAGASFAGASRVGDSGSRGLAGFAMAPLIAGSWGPGSGIEALTGGGGGMW